MITFHLREHEFIELNKLLKVLNLVGSGGEAKQFIRDGEVLLNGAVETQLRKKLRDGDQVAFGGQVVQVRA